MKRINLITLLAAGAMLPALAAEPMSAYLFAYFEGTGGQTEHLRFAVSDNGFDWHALNCNDPVILSDTIAVSGGTRDHHILRGADGKTFYMVATDMQTKKYGWVENPGVVLMKSDNLTDWTHATVELAKAFPENFSDAYWVWAPQTIYDPDAKKYMVYFTVRRKDASKGFTTYYAYANKDFSAFESEPQVLYRTETGCIDNDIMQGPDGRWYMFYKANEGEQKENGIKLAISDSLHGPWVEQPGFVDAYGGNPPVEGSGIFRLNDTGEYVLMYDLYTSGRYEYQTSKDLIHFTREAKAFTKDFFPRHGTVMPITATEKRRLEEKWTCDTTKYTNPILPGFHADPEVLYSEQTGKYYIYSTTDGTPGWGGHNFQVFSSDDIDSGDWKNEGVMLELQGDQVKWATGNAWAPAIIERKEGDGYRYYFYFSGHNPVTNRKEIGVAVSSHPTGPFTDLGHPIVTDSPAGKGQQIDVDVFQDPVSKKYYLYWGNGYMAGAELNDDMLSVKPETVTVMTPEGGTLKDHAYREAPYVFFRNGTYYFMWSVDDTGSPNYHVAYGTSDSPLGPIKVARKPVILKQNKGKQIYGTAHNSVIQIPGTDEWRIVYHRINKNYLDNGLPPADKSKSPGTHRQVCIDPLTFNPDGTIAVTFPSN